MSGSDFLLPSPSPHVSFKPLDEGGVLHSTTDERYFEVNDIGATIWSLLPPRTRSFEELCQLLANDFSDVDIERIRSDVRKFVLELVNSRLAVWPEAPVSGGSSESAGEPANPV